jgi:hypothetical protein
VFTSTLKSNKAKVDHRVLEEQIKSVIKSSRLNLDENAPLKDSRNGACKTFVVAESIRAGGVAVRMQSYDSRSAFAFEASIWQAARATSAAPTFFMPVEIDGVLYGDGGTGWNNPTEEAIAEAHTIWPNRPIGCLVSLGTGLEKELQLGDDKGRNDSLKRSLLRKGLPKVSFNIAVAEYFVASLTSCEKTHRKISEHPEKLGIAGKYFRFNVPQGLSDIGLEEWKKMGDVIASTNKYTSHGDVRRSKEKVARLLLEPETEG